MQVYKGLEIVTNKITHAEKQGVRHYLLEQSVLNRRVDTGVDEMVNAGLMDEVRQNFHSRCRLHQRNPTVHWCPWNGNGQMFKGRKKNDGDDESKKMILQASISSIKRNTRILICKQVDKIQRLINEKMWSVHHIIATDVFKEDRKEAVDEACRNTVLQPFLDIVERFLKNDDHNISIECT
uniref:Cytokinin synthase n=1 Tax=Solanum tuberosum TaxID=4113 RepID=M1DWZ3_SOLTU